VAIKNIFSMYSLNLLNYVKLITSQTDPATLKRTFSVQRDAGHQYQPRHFDDKHRGGCVIYYTRVVRHLITASPYSVADKLVEFLNNCKLKYW
jgi:hypothetical protein